MSDPGSGWLALLRDQMRPLYWLLLALPLAVVLELIHVPGLWVFLAAGVAIIPLAALMGRATESLAETLGPTIGGLLNATFGNAAELIIALFALARGPELFPLVKASLTGSIIGNVLLVLGLSVLAGGLFYKKQTFNRAAAGMGTTLLALAAIGLLVPTLFYHIAPPGRPEELESLSEEIALVLAVVYVLSLVFTLKTHKHLFADEDAPGPAEQEGPEWGRAVAIVVLVVATAGIALMSEFLVGSVEQATQALGMNQVFVGVIVVAVIGNAAEHSTAVMVAIKNKMDLAFAVAIGSGIQIALFVAPVLVFASLLINRDHPLDLHFSLLEVVAMLAAIAILALVAHDGESHWLEGAMLLAVYAIFALAFYHLPTPV